MIGVLNSSSNAFKYVVSALKRSFSSKQILEVANISKSELGALVLISPTEDELVGVINCDCIEKIIVFGVLPKSCSTLLGFELSSWPIGKWGKAPSAEIYQSSESNEIVEYTDFSRLHFSNVNNRPLERFDFMDEWNNLGYGAIKVKDDIWSLSSPVIFKSYAIANVKNKEKILSSYAALLEIKGKSILWFNREVGPIDSYEWHIIEQFLSSYKAEEKVCFPSLVEVPSGYDCAVTMRLDCDEDVESSRYLWEVYKQEKIPFSLAVHTSNLSDNKNFSLMVEVDNTGGAILSHTATHAPNWGGSYESAITEANVSADLIESVIGKRVKYAVSPFHHTPTYALKALSDTGYLGCIGGIVKNDPEFITFNGGNLPDLPSSFIAHSQQVMLHGDCLLQEGDPLRIYKYAFLLAKTSNTIFGYLDHPFSERYQYGWLTEQQRAGAHLALISFIRERSDSPCFFNEIDALEFLQDKSNIEITVNTEQPVMTYVKGYKAISKLVPKVLYKGQLLEMSVND
jgi:hypothetical protein